MGTVTIGAEVYTIIGTVAGATTYLNGSLTNSAIWAAAGAITDKQDRALVEATRLLERQRWIVEGEEVEAYQVPSIEEACYEVAAALLSGTPVVAGAAQSNVKSLDMEGVAVEFWGPGKPQRFPTVVMELVGQYMLTGSTAVAARGAAYYPDDAQLYTSVAAHGKIGQIGPTDLDDVDPAIDD